MTTITVLKAIHLFFMVAWFAGIFYLPRLFVYHAMTRDSQSQALLKTMERRLLYFVTPFALFTLLSGIALIYTYGLEWFKHSGWLHAKLTLVTLLYVYHGYCFVLLKRFKENSNTRSDKFYRVFNELPVLILLAVIFLAVTKPF